MRISLLPPTPPLDDAVKSLGLKVRHERIDEQPSKEVAFSRKDQRYRAIYLGPGSAPDPGVEFGPIVQLYVTYIGNAGIELGEWGTGFIVEEWPHCVVTCGHLFKTRRLSNILLRCPPASGGLYARSVAVMLPPSGVDLAVVAFSEVIPVSCERLQAYSADEGDVDVYGYPAAADELSRVQARIVPPLRRTELTYELRPGSDHTTIGMSGGPLMQGGRLVGIHLGRESEDGRPRGAPVIVDAWIDCMTGAIRVEGD